MGDEGARPRRLHYIPITSWHDKNSRICYAIRSYHARCMGLLWCDITGVILYRWEHTPRGLDKSLVVVVVVVNTVIVHDSS